MAGIVPLPPIHLTQRAFEWLTKSRDMVPPHYASNVNWAACWLPGTDYVHQTYQSGQQFSDGASFSSRPNKTRVVAIQHTGKFYEQVDEKTGLVRQVPEIQGTMQPVLNQDWCCGVGDVRAMYLANVMAQPGDTEEVRAARLYTVQLVTERAITRTARAGWVRKPLLFPTCSLCKVEMDKAFGLGLDKVGRYQDVDENGQVRWQHWPPPSSKDWDKPGSSYRGGRIWFDNWQSEEGK